MTQGQFFKRSLTGLNSEFSFSSTSYLTKDEEPSLPYYLPIAGGRIIGFIPFPRVLVLCEMQSVSSRMWTRVDVSISYDDNHYTTGTGLIVVIVSYFKIWNKKEHNIIISRVISSHIDPIYMETPYIYEVTLEYCHKKSNSVNIDWMLWMCCILVLREKKRTVFLILTIMEAPFWPLF